jgi:A/G-specific adenine glycosylase
VGSAGCGGVQSTFAGSDRQGRGRLVDALRHGPVARADVAAAAGWPGEPERAQRVAVGLVADGLAVEVAGRLSLP